jgi:hypothetical protein
MPLGCCVRTEVAARGPGDGAASDRMADQLDEAAAVAGVPAARSVRQLIAEAVAGRPVGSPEPPSEEELIDLLAEKARQGNVAAIRSLLAREYATDPRERALTVLREMVVERQPGRGPGLGLRAGEPVRARARSRPRGAPPRKAFGRLYVAPAELRSFEADGGLTNKQNVRMETNAGYAVERLPAALRIP